MNSDPEKTPIKTFIRIKPSTSTCTYLKTTKETLTLTKTSGETMQYTIDTIFNEKTPQSKIFEHIKPILKNVVKGINSTVFCYGNTGSGKTYTMFGTDKNPGIVHNFVNHMFDYFNSIQDLFDISVVFSYFQIYNEKVFDMFTNEELCLREFKDEVIIKGLTEKAIDNETEFKDYFEFANKNKKVGSTTLNEFSSRSHTIIRLDCTVDNKKSHVYLIDLAGSENNRKTGNAGIRLLESTNINKSLFILNQVVNAILNKSPSIPYRDSKLTRVLKDSLGGNSVCYILGCIEPEKMEETLRTLEFVSKSRKIICDVKSVVSAYISEKKETVYDRARKQIAQKDNGIFGGSNVYKPFTFGTGNQKTFVSVKDNAIGTKKRVILGEKNINTNNYKIDKDQKIDKSYVTQYHNDSSTFSLSKTIIDSSKESGKSKNKVQIYMSKETLLKMLNSDNFIDIKKIKGIGDKRASDIIEYVRSNGKITELTQLKSILSQKVYEKICKDVI